MTLKQKVCNTASCREVRKDIGRFLDELKQSDTTHPPGLVRQIQQWHDQISEAENAQIYPVDQLQERIKELNCLFAVIETLQTSRPDLKFDETIRKALHVIPDGLQHPGRTGVALQVRENRYTTPLFTEAGRNLVTTCTAHDGVRIELNVSLRSDNGDSTFPEIRALLIIHVYVLFRNIDICAPCSIDADGVITDGSGTITIC